jgi:ABC-type phosphate transport system substrate-binding protein
MSRSTLLLSATWLNSSDLSLAAAAEEPLLVIVHPSSPVEKISSYEIEALFTRTQTRWSDGTPVHPFSFPAGSSAREQFDRVVLKLTGDQVGRFWLDRRIRGLGMPPKQVPTTALMLQIVANLPGSVGYVPGLRVPPGLKIVARIVQGKVVSP